MKGGNLGIKIEEVIEKSGGRKELQELKSAPKKRQRISKMKASSGEIVTNPTDIVNVFVDFYESLYSSTQKPRPRRVYESRAQLPEVQAGEIRKLLKKLKSGRTSANDGLIAEMLKTDCHELLEAIATTFTDILRGATLCPKSWKKSKLIVLFKKGDTSLPKNYRPIAIIPVLGKLYSMLVLSRVKEAIDKVLPVEQAGFREGMGCADHIQAARMCAEKAQEWGCTVWAASLDLEKAFHKVFSEAVEDSLVSAELDKGYIDAITDIYADLSLNVNLNGSTNSRDVAVERGVRQGDPLSPKLFINVLRAVMEKLLPRWEAKRYGILVGEEADNNERLHYLSFADDTTLFAKPKSALRKMLFDITKEFEAVGLKLNADKCKVQCSVDLARAAKTLNVDGMEFPIVSPAEGFGLLGTVFTLTGGTTEEVKDRIRKAWGKFHQIWPLLGHRGSSLGQRIRLFNAVVGRSLLWGCESWTLSAAEKQKLRAVERSMLRKFAGPRRAPDEDWVHWVRRATKSATEKAACAGVKSWVQQHLEAKWRWAGHLARMEDYRSESWAFKATFWRDLMWKRDYGLGSALYSCRPLRARPGRWRRWEEEVWRYSWSLGIEDWRRFAKDKLAWHRAAEDFAKFVWK